MKFLKLQGTGNDFIVIDDRNNKYKGNEAELAKRLCHRNFGIGGDGILFVRNSNVAEIQMVIINADGSYASMCGNGIRCFARYVYDQGILKSNIMKIETGDGIKTAELFIENDKVKGVKINMGSPSFDPKSFFSISEDEIVNKKLKENGKEYSITTMQMGVPHTVIFGKLDDFDVNEGKNIEKNQLFSKGTNVNFCEVIDNSTIKVKTWERGAGPTLACGTGSCACVVAAKRLGLTGDKVKVMVPGGDLFIEVQGNEVFMTGPAEKSFSGEFDD
ncbi:MAG: diaminopimelate epimerase [Solirubrobacterales bacterium]